jgi:hypothetical protein
MEEDDDAIEVESPPSIKNTKSSDLYEQTNVFSRLSQGKKPRNHLNNGNNVPTNSNSLNTS